MKKKTVFYFICVLLVGVGVIAAGQAGSTDWLQFNGNPQHTGVNPAENVIGPGNVSGLKLIYQVSLPAVADSSPVYLRAVTTASGTRNLLFLTTKDGRILALDADTGQQIWAQQNPAGSCMVNQGSEPCFTTSSPAVDPNRQFVYSYGLDGKVHKYRVGDGSETTGGGWPELASTKPFDEKGSSALSIATDPSGTSYLYVSNGGYPGDRGEYQGHITAIRLSDGGQKVFNMVCSNQPVHFVAAPGSPDCADLQTAVWSRAGVVYDSALNRIFLTTGNGPYDPTRHAWGDSVLALNPDGSGSATGDPLDSYTPATFLDLQNTDTDLGSTAPLILPVPSGSKFPSLGFQIGKDAQMRLIDLSNLSGHHAPGFTGGEVVPPINLPGAGGLLTAPVVWVNPADQTIWIILVSAGHTFGVKVTFDATGNPGLQVAWQNSQGGSSPIVANGVLYVATSGDIRAIDPTSGKALWQSTSMGGIHWESPVVAAGKLFITDESGKLSAFGLGSASSLPTPSVFVFLPLVPR